VFRLKLSGQLILYKQYLLQSIIAKSSLCVFHFQISPEEEEKRLKSLHVDAAPAGNVFLSNQYQIENKASPCEQWR